MSFWDRGEGSGREEGKGMEGGGGCGREDGVVWSGEEKKSRIDWLSDSRCLWHKSYDGLGFYDFLRKVIPVSDGSSQESGLQVLCCAVR